MNETLFKQNVVNQYGRDRKILQELLKRSGNLPKQNGLLFCPFHDNFNTPAAKYYEDDNAEHIWCFSENKMYSLADYYTKIMGVSLEEVFSSIWNSLSDGERQSYIDLYGEFSYEIVVDDLDLYMMFKEKKIDYLELQKLLVERE
ncbi:MAG: hypothetical protein J6T15_05280 [Bacilli bacterium]|nr:hypothetical protein [Bacilli bacterium]